MRFLLRRLTKWPGGQKVEPENRQNVNGTTHANWWHMPLAKDSTSPSILRAFASIPPDSALGYMQSCRQGLSQAEADARLKIAGPNVLSSKNPPPWWKLLLLILPNPFTILLVFLAIISVATPQPDWKTFVILMVMILISSAVRFWQEYRSSIAVIKLQSSVSADTKVRRQCPTSGKFLDGTQTSESTIHVKDIVPGDIVIIRPGLTVPADCLILEASSLYISQSTLTGENEPLRKTPNLQPAKFEKEDPRFFELENIAFMGTSVISGSGLGLVLRTGDDSFIATIMKQLNKKRPVNSFQRGIRNVTYMLIGFMLTMVPIVLGISGKTTGNWGNAALFSLSVAVGLVPEMLPAIVNTNLAKGAFSLSKKKTIVKRLDSIQNLGGMSILCSDKTGTLTKDEITLSDYLDCSGVRNRGVFQLAFINAKCQEIQGTSIDSAIINFQSREPMQTPPYEAVSEIAFTFERRRSSCIIRGPTKKLKLVCKGAYEEVLALCTSVRDGAKTLSLCAEWHKKLAAQAERLSSDGFRVILVATREVKDSEMGNEDFIEDDLESSLTLEGFLTFLDPPKEDAAASIQRLQRLGVDVRILTGDNMPIALRLCQLLNLVSYVSEGDAQAITGPELARLEGTDQFHDVIRTCKVFAKLSPAQKGQVILSLKANGDCVGMLGDGINDCVALRFADVGISVDSGAGVAKDCADVILTEKGLNIIVDAVTMGRVTYGNTIKYIKMVASSNFGNVFSILIASAWLPFEPMTSLQLLIQNLLYDISQIAIPWDRMDEEYLQEPKKWDAIDLLRFIIVLGPTSSTIDVLTFCLGWFYYNIRTADDPEAVKLFRTHWFLQGLLTQTIIVHLLRTAKIPIIQSRAARAMVASTTIIMAVGFVLPYIPLFQAALRFVNPAATFVGFLAAELLLYCLEVQLVKVIYKRIFKTWL
ncbi:magnesium-translocating P-type ATPase [Coccidioides immitis RS]|uniref:Magnesium-transporting ATPase, P-type 1 n=2 Tax=Coccidioides immitis TaxID=5501 RepID=A0A0D8JV29_COCIM|nr:magnesium-translocating P-type ATPase [Coccidioides immitis RS]KJF61014.1 magnesium-translocating P-type ATPase [Coccidioides immitis RS]KMP04824.1 magnesium-transporting ATPase [Coccidioides immitis RMSCC 2394]TPX21306.1 hypothetical protein DIZ76_015262 [Coccidioides immitis]